MKSPGLSYCSQIHLVHDANLLVAARNRLPLSGHLRAESARRRSRHRISTLAGVLAGVSIAPPSGPFGADRIERCAPFDAVTASSPLVPMLLLLYTFSLLFFGSRGCVHAAEIPSQTQLAEQKSGIQVINNNLLRYGNYCGPGPDELCPGNGCRTLPTLPPVDAVDR